MKTRILPFLAFFITTACAHAQFAEPPTNRANLVFGVGQLLFGGFNVEGNLMLGRLSLDYSHGVSLETANADLEDGPDKDQGLSIKTPWTTGFGVGYRFTDVINLRVEPKLHKFELYQDGSPQTGAAVGDYTTFTLGLGLYANFRPFRRSESLLRGIMIVPNVRWWPRLSSSLDDNQFTYFSERSGKEEVHEARQIGLANTAFFVNISIGYSIDL